MSNNFFKEFPSEKPCVIKPKSRRRRGQRRPTSRPLKHPVPVEALWERSRPKWQRYHIKNTEKGPVVWEVQAGRFWIAKGGFPIQEYRLLVPRNVRDGQVKYFLSNAPEDVRSEVFVHVGFTRWHIERLHIVIEVGD